MLLDDIIILFFVLSIPLTMFAYLTYKLISAVRRNKNEKNTENK